MTSGHPRRVSTASLPGFELVPPAPPLPPQQARYPQAARYAIGRVLGFGSRPEIEGPQRASSIARQSPLLTSRNATAVHRTGLAISSLSINESGSHALVAGKDVFKTIRVDDSSCTEDVNIRAAISSYRANVGDSTSTDGRSKDGLEIHDVAWAKGTTSNLIAAATINGPIVLYDLNRLGIELARLFEHRRQVHRVTFNPHAGHYMLSASQDGTVRMWDIRDHQRNVMSFPSQRSIPGQSEGIRDVKWSPTNGTEFALGTDTGWITKWDTQMMRIPKARISGHVGVVNTIDWHPDGKHLLSAGSDKAVRVWNVHNEARRNRLVHEIKVPHPLRNARWRPSYQSMLHGAAGMRQCTQLVTSYDRDHPVLHIWDLRRQHVPFRELETNPTAPTDLLWHSQDLLWTAGREGIFTQTDVSFAQKIIDKRNVQSFTISPQGDISIVTQTRRPKSDTTRTRAEGLLQRLEQSRTDDEVTHESSAMARSAGDDTLDDNFLSVGLNISRRKSGPTSESRSVTDTPPSEERSKRTILPLDGKTERFRFVKPVQSAARGPLPGNTDVLLMTYFAQKYKLRPYLYPPTVDSFINISEIYNQNAGYAQLASMYRLAQSWRLMGHVVSKALQRRAEDSRRLRIKPKRGQREEHDMRTQVASIVYDLLRDQAVRASNPATPLAMPQRRQGGGQGGGQAGVPGSTSNVATPKARPSVSKDHGPSGLHDADVPGLDSSEAVELPPSLMKSYQRSPNLLDDVRMDGIDDSPEKSAGRFPAKPSFDLEWQNMSRRDATRADRDPPALVKHDSSESFVFPLDTSSAKAPSIPTSVSSNQSNLMTMVRENLKAMGDDSPEERSASFEQYVRQYARNKHTKMEGQDRKQHKESDKPAEKAPAAIDVPERPRSRGDVGRDMQVLLRNNQESFTSETDINPNSHEERIPMAIQTDRPTSKESGHNEETAADGGFENQQRRPSMQKHKSLFDPDEGVFAKSRSHSPELVDGDLTVDDFLASTIPPETSQCQIITLVKMLQELIRYHTVSLSDAQSLTAMLMITIPLLQEISPLLPSTMRTTLAYYLDHLSSLQMPDDAISTILNTSTAHLLLSGLNPLQIEAVLVTYHDQLLGLSLPVNAALLRRLSYPTFPSVYDTALKENQLSFLCTSCRKPLLSPRNASRKKCESCKSRPPQCPICWTPESPYEFNKSKKHKAKRRKYEAGGHAEQGTDSALHANPTLEGKDATRLSSIYTRAANSRPPTGYADIPHIPHGPAPHHGDDLEAEDEVVHSVEITPTLFTTCLTCNHSAHAACLAAWHGVDAFSTPHSGANSPALGSAAAGLSSSPRIRFGRSADHSNGLCPVEGCLCACIAPERSVLVAGTAGTHHPTSATLERSGSGLSGSSKSTRRSVLDDELKAGESKAVLGARRSLGILQRDRLSGASGGSGSAGSLSAGARSLENLK